MIEDVFCFFMEKVLPCFFMGLFLLMILAIPGCIEHERQIKECFMQEVKTKECEYMLWKRELSKCGNNSSSNLATGMVIGTAMSASMRR